MIVQFLVGQRKCDYHEEYDIEILEVFDWVTEDANRNWKTEKFDEYYQSKEFSHLRWISVDISYCDLRKQLYGQTVSSIVVD